MKDEAKKTKQEPKKIENLTRGDRSINLIPKLTQAEAKVVTKKIRLNTSAAVALLFFIVFTIIVVGINIFTKLDLNNQKQKLYAIENTLGQKKDLLLSNEEILRRVNLYKKIESTTVSSKQVVVYWQNISKGLGNIEAIELTEGLNFSVGGSAKTLTDVSKLWYLLGNDNHIESVNLKSVVKDKTGARFIFEGKLNFDEFNNAS